MRAELRCLAGAAVGIVAGIMIGWAAIGGVVELSNLSFAVGEGWDGPAAAMVLLAWLIAVTIGAIIGGRCGFRFGRRFTPVNRDIE